MRTLILNLSNNTFQLKTLLFFVHLRSQQKKTESRLQLSNLQCCHFHIVILRVAVISNVQNVRLQRRHKPTDDAPLIDGVVHNRLVQQTMTHLLRHQQHSQENVKF